MTHRLLPAVASVAAIALLPAGAAIATTTTSAPAADHAANAAHAAGRGAHSAVTWNGWRGVRFGDTVRSAHRALGGHYYRGSADKGACGDILDTRTATVDAKVGPYAHRVSDISVDTTKHSIDFPYGIDSSLNARQITRRLEAHGHHVRSVTEPAEGDTYVKENTSVGPHGHALYFLAAGDTGEVYRLGMALDRSVARQQMRINGC